jgi:hypothetical protein
MENNFIVECNVCRQRYENWTGSTPCCGSIAYLVGESGKVLKDDEGYGMVMLYLSHDKE